MNLLNKNKKGFTLSELIAVLVILSIIISLSSVIYINVRKNALEADYDNLKMSIEEVARKYASDTNIMIVSVEDLIKAGYITPDDGSDIYDPRTNTSMNCYLIYTKFVDGEYVSELRDEVDRDSNGKCSSYAQSSTDSICRVNGSNCESIDNGTWFNDNITLGIKYNNVLLNDGDASFNWSSNYGDSSSSATIKTNVSLLGKITYKCEVDTGANKITATKTVNIDKENPIITNLKYNTNVTEGKDVTIEASDGNGSGIKEYALVLSDEECDGNYQESANFSIDLNGDYKACVIDKVGNKSEEKIFKINTIKPGVPVLVTKLGDVNGEDYDGTYWANKDVYMTTKARMNETMSYYYKLSTSTAWIEINKEDGGVTFKKSVNATVTAKSCLDDACSDISTAKTIKIDKDNPTISNVSYNTSLTTDKTVTIIASDSGGSGIKEYSVVSADKSCKEAYSVTNSFKITKNGSYKACVKDGAGNESSEFAFEITTIVPGPPTIETYLGSASGSTYSGSWTTQNVYVKIIPHATADEISTSYQYKIGTSGDWANVSGTSGFTISSNTKGYVYVRSCNGSACNSTTSNGKQVRIDKNKPTIYAKSSSNSATYGSSYDTSNYFRISYSISEGYVLCSPSNVSRMSTGRNYVSCTAYGYNGLSSSAYTYVTVSESIPSKPKVTMYYHSSGIEYNGGRSTESIDIHFYSEGASYYNYYYCTGCPETATNSTSTTYSEDIEGYIYVEACNSSGRCSSYTKADIWIERSGSGGDGGGSTCSKPVLTCYSSEAWVMQENTKKGQYDYLSVDASGCSAYATLNSTEAYKNGYTNYNGAVIYLSNGTQKYGYSKLYNEYGVETDNFKYKSGNCQRGYCRAVIYVGAENSCGTTEQTFTYYLRY